MRIFLKTIMWIVGILFPAIVWTADVVFGIPMPWYGTVAAVLALSMYGTSFWYNL